MQLFLHWGMPLMPFLPTGSYNKTKPSVSPWKELEHTSGAPPLVAASHLPLTANGACIHETHRTLANKNKSFKLMHTCLEVLQLPGQLSLLSFCVDALVYCDY